MLVKASAVESAIATVKAHRRQDNFKSDPVGWAEYMLGTDEGTLWSKQREIARAVVDNNSTAVKAGHGVGKSRLMAVLICWWVDTRYPHCYVISTAPSMAQVQDVLWREVMQLKDIVERRFDEGLIDHKLPGRITMDVQWKDDVTKLPLGRGRKPPDNLGGNSFQGIHGDVLAIGDEACGLSGELIDALANITTNEASRRVLIANPTDPMSYLGKIFKEEMENWKRMSISVLESPNFTGEPMPPKVLQKLTGPSYVEQKKLEYGEDSARFKARVLGEFAFDIEDSLILPGDVEKACLTERERIGRPVLGVDVARFGADRSVVYLCVNGVVRFVDSWAKTDLVHSAQRVHDLALREGAHAVAIDCDGIGGGMFDILNSYANRTYDILAVRGSMSSPDRGRWHNYRSYMWDSFRYRCRTGELDLDPLDIDLHDELLSVGYSYNTMSGGLVLDSKDKLKKDVGKSPDLADAAVYAAITDQNIRDAVQQETVFSDAGDMMDDDEDSYLMEMGETFGFNRILV